MQVLAVQLLYAVCHATLGRVPHTAWCCNGWKCLQRALRLGER